MLKQGENPRVERPELISFIRTILRDYLCAGHTPLHAAAACYCITIAHTLM